MNSLSILYGLCVYLKKVNPSISCNIQYHQHFLELMHDAKTAMPLTLDFLIEQIKPRLQRRVSSLATVQK